MRAPEEYTSGSKAEFADNWRFRNETRHNYWTKGRPSNQIQLAFRNHWKLFSQILNGKNPGLCLEVGCGRGSISSYFAGNGYSTVLLDSSEVVLERAKAIFNTNNHKAHFIRADALCLPFKEASFDVVLSIGLLEHFSDIGSVMREQIRILRPGGIFLGYIVPERKDTIQKYFTWLNRLLKILHCGKEGAPCGIGAIKKHVFRTDYQPKDYVDALAGQPVTDTSVTGVYPLPLLSYSPEFPFSLESPFAEFIITRVFELVLFIRKILFGRNPWICRVSFGQAFLLTCKKGV